MTSLTSSCELFTRSHAGHISKLTEVLQYLYLLTTSDRGVCMCGTALSAHVYSAVIKMDVLLVLSNVI